jgi:hypothetical protein
MIVEGKAIQVAQVACLTDADHDRFRPTVETPKHLGRRDLRPVPRPDCVLDWLE